jgi:cyclic pyranopterin phosphate synthase
MRNIRLAVEAGFRNRVKVNVVVMKGVNDDELLDFVRLTEDTDIDVRFIEYMPFDGNKWSNRKLLPYRDILKIIRKEFPSLSPILNEEGAEGFFNQTSKPFRLEGFKGRIGFITSMTDNFCSTCNRIRITADGHLKVCYISSFLYVISKSFFCRFACSAKRRFRYLMSWKVTQKKQLTGSL